MENSNNCHSITFIFGQHLNHGKFCCKMCVSLIWEDAQTNVERPLLLLHPRLSLWKALNGVEIYNFLWYSCTVETARLLFTEFAARISRCRFQSLPVRFSQLKCSLATLTNPPPVFSDGRGWRKEETETREKQGGGSAVPKQKEGTDRLPSKGEFMTQHWILMRCSWLRTAWPRWTGSAPQCSSHDWALGNSCRA